MRNLPMLTLLLPGCGLFGGATDTADSAPPPTETCNGEDDDGDGQIDEDVADLPAWYADDDADGFGDPLETTSGCDAPSGFIADQTDCDDTNALINPGVEEDGGNEVDENCDGVVDDTCGPHAPVIDSAEPAFDPAFDFGRETGPAMTVLLHFTDVDGDVDRAKFRMWMDYVVDGTVDTSGDPNSEMNEITLDDDPTCVVAEEDITLAYGAANLVDTYTSVELALSVSDALDHWSEPVVVEAPLE